MRRVILAALIVAVLLTMSSLVAFAASPVNVDIKPGSNHNSVNLKSSGLLPVALLGSAELDVRTVRPETIMIGDVDLPENGSYDNRRLMYGYEDLNGDGYQDLVGEFVVYHLVRNGVLTAETTSLTVTAQLSDGTEIVGQDSVAVTPSSAK